MLTPKQIEELQDFAFTVTDPVNSYLISDICRRIAKAGKITDTAAYQIYRAQALGESKRNIKKMLSERLGYTTPKINALFADAAEISYMQDVALFADTIDKPASVAQTVKSAARLANDEWKNITQTIGMIAPNGEALPLQKVYRACMDDAFNKVHTGAMDYTRAIRHASRHLADYGVRVIEYESGVHTSLEAAVRRNIMGGLGLMVEDIAETNHAKLDCDGWELSAHAASAPDHEPYQGKQYTDAEYKALNGTPEKDGKLRRRIGTLNCGHVAFPIILGVNQPQYTDEQLRKFKDDNAKGVTYQGKHYTMYEAKQKLRELERNIRLQKRRIEAADALNDKPKLQAAQIRLGLLRREYKSFAKSAGLIMEPERTQSTYFGHSAASKAVWAFKKSNAYGGLGAGGLNGDATSGGSKHLGDLDFTDTDKIKRLLNAAQGNLGALNHEVDITVTSDGSVWQTVGSEGRVDPQDIETEKGVSLKGAYSYHNHPPKATNYSFSEDDAGFFFGYGLQYSQASDDRFVYYMERTDDTASLSYDEAHGEFLMYYNRNALEMGFDGVIDYEQDAYHVTMEYLAEKYHFIYERVRKVGQ